MKLGRLDDERLGLVTDAGFVDISTVFSPNPRRPYVDTMVQLIERWDELKGPITALQSSASPLALDVSRLGPPLRRPRKIVNLCTEVKDLQPDKKPPIDWFFKSPESVTGPNGQLILPPHYATEFLIEAEIAVVIGQPCRNVPVDEADTVIFGYTAVLDGMGDGLGRGMGTYFNKSFDTFCPMGPTILINEPSLDAAAFDVRLDLNGAPAESYSRGSLAHSVAELIADVSTYFQLMPGDVVACGSPTNRSIRIAHGDSITLDVTTIGSMSLSVDDPLCRHRERVA